MLHNPSTCATGIACNAFLVRPAAATAAASTMCCLNACLLKSFIRHSTQSHPAACKQAKQALLTMQSILGVQPHSHSHVSMTATTSTSDALIMLHSLPIPASKWEALICSASHMYKEGDLNGSQNLHRVCQQNSCCCYCRGSNPVHSCRVAAATTVLRLPELSLVRDKHKMRFRSFTAQ